MHRADYQRVLADEAHRLGAKFQFGADVMKIDSSEGHAMVTLADGESLTADVVVGADGLRGNARTFVLGHVKEPEGSGDLAYRITIPRAKLENDPDPFIRRIVADSVTAIWCQYSGKS
jgi:salicylate hydroxylase